MLARRSRTIRVRSTVGRIWFWIVLLNVSSLLVLECQADQSYRVLFEAYENNNWDVCSVRPDGTDRQNLTATKDLHELYPQASPDGQWICFLLDEIVDGATQRSLWLMKANGEDRKKIANRARHACWHPDSRQIAFAKQEFQRFMVKDFVSKGIYFYDVDSGKTKPHPNPDIEHTYVPTWSADGQWIVTTVHGGMGFGHAIIGIQANGSRVVDLGIGGCRPCWSNDGKQLTWSRDDHTVMVAQMRMTDDGPQIQSSTVLFHHQTQHLYHPDFSPDGKFVTFSMGPGGRVAADGPGTHTEVAEMVGVKGPWNLYIKRIDSDEPPSQLTTNAALSNKESEWLLIK